MISYSYAWDMGSPCFYRLRDGAVDAIGSDPASLASRAGESLDSRALLQDMALGFELGCRTLFQSVCRLLPWERLVVAGGRRVVQIDSYGEAPSCVLDVLSRHASTAFAEGAALELTGGLDSRLLLAAGLRNGVKPNFSFTIGDEGDADVIAASTLAKEFGFRHRSIPVVVDRQRIARDAIAFVRASGYSANATCYAWLPATLAALDGDRTAQISGAGGEVVGGFYYTPFDTLVEPLRLQRQWITTRLMPTCVAWRQAWDSSLSRDLEAELIAGVLRAVNAVDGSWRERVDAFYSNERVRRWAVPVLDASCKYYNVIAPYLSKEYYAWCAALPIDKRVDRRAQRDLLFQASPKLAQFRAFGGGVSARSNRAIFEKVVKRLTRKKLPSALGAVRCAVILAEDSEIRSYVRALAYESNVGLSVKFIEYVLDHPDEHVELLGSVVTAAVAWHDLQRRGNEIAIQGNGVKGRDPFD